MKESYISLITPECKNCLSFKKEYSKDVLPVGFKLLSNMQSSKNQLNQIHTNIDKNLINQYLGKIFNKCENSKTKCYTYKSKDMSGKIVSQTLTISSMTFPKLNT